MDKKITLAIGISDFRIGGAQKLVSDVLSHIDHDQFEVHLITLMQFDEQESFYDTIPDHVHVHKVHFKGFKDIGAWMNTVKLLRKIRPDVVWSNLFFTNTVLRFLKLLVGYKVVSIEQNTYLSKNWKHKLADRYLAKLTYRIVAVSKYLVEFTSEDEGIPKEKFVVIHNGTDVGAMSKRALAHSKVETKNELGFSPEDKLIVNIGQLIAQKNQALLVDAFNIFSKKHPDYKLLILGEGAVIRKELEEKVEEYGLSDKVFLMGIQRDVPKFLNVSEFFVLSSRFEGFPIVIIEALACGLPIISTPVSGSDEYVHEGKNGFLAQETADDLGEKMSQLAASSTDEKEKLSKHAGEVSLQYDIALITKKYETLFKDALKKG